MVTLKDTYYGNKNAALVLCLYRQYNIIIFIFIIYRYSAIFRVKGYGLPYIFLSA